MFCMLVLARAGHKIVILELVIVSNDPVWEGAARVTT
jgi:hypothetical protein